MENKKDTITLRTISDSIFAWQHVCLGRGDTEKLSAALQRSQLNIARFLTHADFSERIVCIEAISDALFEAGIQAARVSDEIMIGALRAYAVLQEPLAAFKNLRNHFAVLDLQ